MEEQLQSRLMRIMEFEKINENPATRLPSDFSWTSNPATVELHFRLPALNSTKSTDFG
jgi:hypothetical protein